MRSGAIATSASAILAAKMAAMLHNYNVTIDNTASNVNSIS
jgi:hypothetical protein